MIVRRDSTIHINPQNHSNPLHLIPIKWEEGKSSLILKHPNTIILESIKCVNLLHTLILAPTTSGHRLGRDVHQARAGIVVDLHACVLDVWGADLVEECVAVAAGVLLLGLFTHVGEEFGGTPGGLLRWEGGSVGAGMG